MDDDNDTPGGERRGRRSSPVTSPSALPWWRVFFESPHSLRLAFFPTEHVTAHQVAALQGLLSPWRPRRVLDLCCGRGRHLVPLARRGHPMVGLDASSFMVDEALAAVRQAQVSAGIVRGEAQRLPFVEGAFDVVLCLFNSFGYLQPDDENEQVLHEVVRCLEPGGRFLLDTRNRNFQFSHLPFSEIVSLEEGGAVWLECNRDASGDRLISLFRSPGTGEVLYEASIRVYALDELRTLFDRAGLRIDRISGGYDWGPFRSHSRELLILAHKA
jgi:SAM-dependent methyltransferase